MEPYEIIPKKPKRNLNVKRVGLAIGLLVLLFVSGLAAGAWMFLSKIHNPTSGPEAGQGQAAVAPRVNVLVMGLDKGVNGPTKSQVEAHTSRTDTMMVFSLDPEFKTAGVLWIPRDTRVKIPGRNGYDKITHAHAYGGPKLAMETASALIGEPIPYYVRLDFEGFKKIIDMIGGVEITVEQNMDYEDPYQDLYIHIKAGKQTLNGEKSLQFVRYRQYPEGDIGRVKAQQKFLDALMKSFFDMNTLWKIPGIAREAAEYVDTNIEPAQILALANVARQVSRDEVQMAVVPGQPADISDAGGLSLSYWVADQQQLQKTVDLLVRGIDREANSKVRVEVLNGTGIAGLADKVSKKLKDLGYLVVKVGNAEKKNDGPTRITGSPDNAQVVKGVCRQILEFAPKATMQNRSPGEEVDVSITLGADCSPGQ